MYEDGTAKVKEDERTEEEEEEEGQTERMLKKEHTKNHEENCIRMGLYEQEASG